MSSQLLVTGTPRAPGSRALPLDSRLEPVHSPVCFLFPGPVTFLSVRWMTRPEQLCRDLNEEREELGRVWELAGLRVFWGKSRPACGPRLTDKPAAAALCEVWSITQFPEPVVDARTRGALTFVHMGKLLIVVGHRLGQLVLGCGNRRPDVVLLAVLGSPDWCPQACVPRLCGRKGCHFQELLSGVFSLLCASGPGTVSQEPGCLLLRSASEPVRCGSCVRGSRCALQPAGQTAAARP